MFVEPIRGLDAIPQSRELNAGVANLDTVIGEVLDETGTLNSATLIALFYKWLALVEFDRLCGGVSACLPHFALDLAGGAGDLLLAS